MSQRKASLWSKLLTHETLTKQEFCKIIHDLFRTERELDRAELSSKRDAQPLCVEDLS
jgi:hypothetical protein